MRVALIGPTYPFRGGISHYTTLLYKHLKGRHDVRFFAFKRQYPKWLFPGATDLDPSEKRIQEEGVEHIIDSMNPVTWLKTAKRIAQFKPDITVIQWWVSFWSPQFFIIASLIKKFCKTKVLFICHNVVEHESTFIDKTLTRIVLKKGDFFIVHSNEDRTNLLAMIPDASVRKNFLPTYDVFNFSSIDMHEIRKELHLSGPVMLFFGFIRDYKGLEYLLKAMPMILTEIPATLIVVGEFWKNKEYYLNLVETLGVQKSVVFVDEYVPNEDVGKYFSASDLVVQPYTSATGSAVVQTAFGFYKPVVATQVGSLPEVVEDGKTGYLVAPGSEKEIAHAVLKFFKENKAEEFQQYIKRTNYRFSWQNMVDSIENFIS